MSKYGVLILSLAIFSGAAQAAQIYHCKDKWNRPIYSQTPCAKDAKKITVTSPEKIGTVSTSSEDYKAIQDSNNLRDVERAINSKRRALSSLQSSMDKELRRLRHKKRYSANNLAGAQWESSISEEMNAVVQSYRARMDSVRASLDLLQEKKQRLAASLDR